MKLYLNEDVLEKYKKLNDNDLCLCGSGKIFCKCHKVDLSVVGKINSYQLFSKIKKIKESKLCFCKNKYCNDVYTYSHSIPRSSLENISTCGHVYRFDLPTPKHSLEVLESYSLEPIKKGVKETSCYYGFCNFHDTEVFYPIEMEEIIPTGRQVLLTRYRALTKEIYNKTQSTKLIPISNEVITTNSTNEGKINQAAFHAQFSAGTYRSLEEYYRELEKCQKSLFQDRTYDLNYLQYVFDNEFPVQCCSFVNPVYSPLDCMINDYNDFIKDSVFFSFNVFYRNNKTFVIFTWEKQSQIELFMKELIDRIKGNECNYIIQFIFAFSENHAFSITWWDSLSPLCQYRCRPARRRLYEVQQEFQEFNPEKGFATGKSQCLFSGKRSRNRTSYHQQLARES